MDERDAHPVLTISIQAIYNGLVTLGGRFILQVGSTVLEALLPEQGSFYTPSATAGTTFARSTFGAAVLLTGALLSNKDIKTNSVLNTVLLGCLATGNALLNRSFVDVGVDLATTVTTAAAHGAINHALFKP